MPELRKHVLRRDENAGPGTALAPLEAFAPADSALTAGRLCPLIVNLAEGRT
ncbi:hypothetical protein [Burkholderia ubonensis]|uniref:hypothetical protein n=1 Tax=Burkholderia ubonensis TaxID=101571 RepID=UPI000B30052E|nr:hypothetical protein [Burkholderia ubonensis]